MGHRFSAVHGVKSDNFYQQGNAINEIWVGDVEVISRLPFGDSDLGQAGWPPGSWPKIPWHQFVIPLKREEAGTKVLATSTPNNESTSTYVCFRELPKRGYFEMYRSLPPSASLVIGIVILGTAFALWSVAVYISHWTDFWLQMFRRAKPEREGEAVLDIKRWFKRCMKGMIGHAVAAMILSILGLPAVTAGLKGMNAADAFVWQWSGTMVVLFVWMIANPIFLTRRTRRTITRCRQPPGQPPEEV